MNTLSNKQVIGIALIIVTTFLLLSTTVMAQETGSSSTTSVETTTEVGQEIIQNTPENQVDLRQDRQKEQQVTLSEIRQQRILNLSANISNRIESAIGRLFNIIDRLESRIEKIKQTGVNTEPAELKLREAAHLLAEARAKLGISIVLYIMQLLRMNLSLNGK